MSARRGTGGKPAAFGIGPDEFRRLALALPDAVEGAHMGHADFRVRKRIFATLGSPDAHWGMVKLAPEQQELFMRVDAAFVPAKGAWGRQGYTLVRLDAVRADLLHDALTAAWRTIAQGTKARGPR
ncbi:MmcQ/YjbR family DNA-binding protein [Dokdonella sp.]|uniref:MmcQ/YjbR family DNA-binding protein n=1 Tax=Dokdonella sp. TaxID=2291710 RepID=UPI002F4181BD